MTHKKLTILACAMVLLATLSGCGKDDAAVPETTVSPSASAAPTATPGSVSEWDENTGDVTDSQNSVAPGNHSAFDSTQDSADAHDGSSRGEDTTGSEMKDDLNRAGEDLGSAIENAESAVGDAMDGTGGREQRNAQ